MSRTIIDLYTRPREIRWPAIYRDCEAILNTMTTAPEEEDDDDGE